MHSESISYRPRGLVARRTAEAWEHAGRPLGH